MHGPISVLVDTSVWRLAEFAKPVTVERSVRVLGREQSVKILAMRRCGPYSPWKERQLESLPTIARLAREGRLKLFHSGELEIENFKGAIVGGAAVFLFDNVPVFQARPPVERSRFQQMDMDEYSAKATFVRFCKWLLSLDLAQLNDHPRFSELLGPAEVLERFRAICRDLSEEHLPDAFHLWTAEANRLEYFLSADKKFVNVMTLTKRMQLNSAPIAPRDLLRSLGTTTLDPLPIPDWDIRPLS